MCKNQRFQDLWGCMLCVSLRLVSHRRIFPTLVVLSLASTIPSGNGLCSLIYDLCEVIQFIYIKPTAVQLYLMPPNFHNLGTVNHGSLFIFLTASMISSSSIIIPHVNHLFSESQNIRDWKEP